MTPGHDRAITQNGSESAMNGLYLNHIVQLILHIPAVATVPSTTPGHDGSVTQNGSKSAGRGLDLLHILQLMLHCTAGTSLATQQSRR